MLKNLLGMMYLHITLPYGSLSSGHHFVFLLVPFFSVLFLHHNGPFEKHNCAEKVPKYKNLYFTVLKKEILKRILLSGFKVGWSIAVILYIAKTHEFQVASHPYLD